MSTTQYDIIFAGGGTAACVIAGRLANADASLKILVLEAGPHTKDKPEHTQPARFSTHLAPTSKTMSFNVANAAPELNGRQLIAPSARCVGGGSSVNFMMYTRAAASDYDDWEIVHGNSGWGSKDLIPLARKSETYQVDGGRPTHGYSGPLKVSHGGAFTNVGKQFLETASAHDNERGLTDDANCMTENAVNKYARWAKWIDVKTGKRSDVPHHFIYNQDHKNLTVLDGKRVNCVVFEGTRASGVEYINDIVSNPGSDQTPIIAKASKFIIVAAGAFGSPAILERSGIGSKAVLDKFGITQVVDLPGVGQSYQDHTGISVSYFADDEAETHDAFMRGAKDEVEKLETLWTTEGKGLLANNAFDAGIKLRPTETDLKDLGPQFEKRWAKYFANAPDKPIMWLGPVSRSLLGNPGPRKYIDICYVNLYPVSYGSVHIKSADPHASLDFTSGFLRDEADIVVMRWGYKKARELVRRMGFYRGEFVPGHPVFPTDSAAVCQDVAGPMDISAADIVYTAEDNNAIDIFTRNRAATTFHALGTCAMKKRDKGGVVDEHLNVYGVQGLKVADLSIAPSNVGSNTYSTALIIGEKAAGIIAGELGIDYTS